MALPSVRIELRVALSHVDAGVERQETVLLQRHPSETAKHVILRLLAWCLLPEPPLTFAPALEDPDAADLWAHDLTGRLTTWVECGSVTPEKLKKVVQHNPGAQIHVVLDDPKRRDELLAALADWKKGRDAVHLWTLDPTFVATLAANDSRRHKWTLTIVGHHLYLEADGSHLDGALDAR